jgi:hypothetical protein
MTEPGQPAKTRTEAAMEHLCLQLGSERAWRMAYEMELKWRKAEGALAELRKEMGRLERRLELRRFGRGGKRKRAKAVAKGKRGRAGK